MEEYEGEAGLRVAQLLLWVARLAALILRQKALGAVILLLIAPRYTILGIFGLASLDHFSHLPLSFLAVRLIPLG